MVKSVIRSHIMKKITILLLTLALCVNINASVASSKSQPQQKAAEHEVNHPQPIYTFTRLTTVFSKKEQELQHAIFSRDKSAMNKLLDNSFAEHLAAQPTVAIMREQWVQKITQQNKFGEKIIDEMSTFNYGNVVIVSFQLLDEKHREPAIFIVDIWQGTDENAKLLLRFSATTNSPNKAIFGDQGVLPKKYQ